MRKQFLSLLLGTFLVTIANGQKKEEWVTIPKGSALNLVDSVKKAGGITILRVNIPDLKMNALMSPYHYRDILRDLVIRDVCVYISEDEIRAVGQCNNK